MAATDLATARKHYREQQRLTAATVRRSAQLWRGMDFEDLDRSWTSRVLPPLYALVAGAQLMAARGGAEYVPAVGREQNLEPDVLGAVNATALAGVSSVGIPLEDALVGALYATKDAISDGARGAAALHVGRLRLQRRVQLEVADAGRVAASVAAVGDRRFTSYVRMLVPPSCSRCAVLAGRVYGMQTAFQRHPRCDCRHIPTRESVAGDLVQDPRDYFDSLEPTEAERVFTKAGAQAIRDGADIAQVVNARRGMYTTATGAQSTRAGTSGRGMYGSSQTTFDPRTGSRVREARRARPMPERIYQLAGSREEAIRLLRYYRYIF